MPEVQWARLNADVKCELRRGAWYRVLRVSDVEAVLEVIGRQVLVPRRILEIVTTRPSEWAVIRRPRDAVRIPPSWGALYAVCPSCRNRAALTQRASSMRCAQCNGLFDVAWDHVYTIEERAGAA